MKLVETTWGSQIDPNYTPDPNFIIRDRKPGSPKYVCKACKKRCKFTKAVKEYCLFKGIDMKAVLSIGKTKKGRA